MKLFPSCKESSKPMYTSKFWPLDYDPEVEIYDNPAWNLPGFRRRRPAKPVAKTARGRIRSPR
jgi:hypothetical protein